MAEPSTCFFLGWTASGVFNTVRRAANSASPRFPGVKARPTDDGRDDDTGRPGGPIEDPLLRATRTGADIEPAAGDLRKHEDPVRPRKARRGLRGWLRALGPGLITGASDDDPSGIATYAQVGSRFGYGLMWTALFTFPMMAAVEELCARVALHTGVGLGKSLRRRFPTGLVGACIAALFVANTINVGADLGAVAAGGSLLTRGAVPQVWLVVPVAALVVGLQLFATYAAIFKVLKWLTVALFAYVATAIMAHPDIGQVVASSLVPHVELNRDYIAALVAVLGTTISPYLFFWQASSEVDVMRAEGTLTEVSRRGVDRAVLRAARADIAIGMFFSNAVMFSIMLTSAAVLHPNGRTDIQTADQAAQALAPLAGQWAFALFALGLIGTGLLAIPILTGSAAYAVRDFLGLKGALADKPAYRPTFYGIVVMSTVAGIAINLLGVDPMRALFVTAVINGLVAPPLLVLIVILGSSREVMGRRTSGVLSRTLCWATAGLMGAAAIALLLFSVALR
jgi:NRAMP (natural resistance-associated macrophage protein)-like metal ion transporter